MAPGEPEVKRQSWPALDLLVIDNPVWELTLLMESLPHPDEVAPERWDEFRRRSVAWVEAGGGSAANTAVFMAALGRQAGVVGNVGDDIAGQRAREELKRYHLFCSVSVLAGRSTKQSIIIKEQWTDRGFFKAWVPDRIAIPVQPDDVSDILWNQAKLIHLDRVSEVAHQKIMSAPGPAVSLDLHTCPGRPVVRERLEELIPKLSVLQVSESAAITLGGGDGAELERWIRHLGSRVPWVVVTQGARGAIAAESGQIFRVEPWPTEVVDSTGAGDTFCACLLDSWLSGQSLRDATHRAALAGALQCRSLGARGFIPSQELLASLLGSTRFRYNGAATWSGGADVGSGRGGDHPGVGPGPCGGEKEG